ncbi:MAG: hypothetical protein AAFZ67_00765 [Planctomycetota bacterium]
MESVAEISLLGLSLALVIYVIADYLRGRSELVSIRNVAVGGFVLFQTLSAALWLIDDKYDLRYFLLEPGATGIKFAVAATVFAVVALSVYRSGFIARPIARLVPKPNVVPADVTMLLTAVVLTVSAAVFRFAVLIPYVAVLASILGTAVAGASAGLAGWLIGRNLRNPIIWVLAGAVIVANLGIAVSGTYGRRTIISIGLGVAFGLYYSRLRYESPRRTVAMLLLAAVPLVMFLAAYTSVRGGDNRRAGALQVARNVFSAGNIKAGLEDADGQGTGGVSLWLMEFFGEDGQREPDTLRAFQYFILFPAPRAIFPFKPNPLSLDIPAYANLEGVNIGGLTIGPGIIGHSFADGGWLVLLFYASFGGVVLRFGDEIIRRSPHAPFVVLPMGSMLGEMMGVPRGESSAMLFQFVFGTASCYAYITIVAKGLEYFGYAQKGDADVSGMGAAGWEAGDDPDDDPYAEFSDYGEDDYGEHDYNEDGYSQDDGYTQSDEPAA